MFKVYKVALVGKPARLKPVALRAQFHVVCCFLRSVSQRLLQSCILSQSFFHSLFKVLSLLSWGARQEPLNGSGIGSLSGKRANKQPLQLAVA